MGKYEFEVHGELYHGRFYHFRDLSSTETLELIDNAIADGQLSDKLLDKIYDATNVTVCEIEDSAFKVVSVGYAFCSPRDQFSKKLGCQIAFSRAKSALCQKE